MYTTTYVAPNIQDASIPTYVVRNNVADILLTTPNLKDVQLAKDTINAELRAEMEKRLALLTEEQLTAVQKGHNIEDTANASVLTDVERGDAEIDYGENQYITDALDDPRVVSHSDEITYVEHILEDQEHA